VSPARIEADAIDALLPQTQCRRCGFDGCRPYAEALSRGEAAINRCPPGGTATIERLAALQAVPVQALDPACGTESPPAVAVIDEARCIGCARCLPPCPVDAIVGAPRQLHTVLYALCTGCELCLAPCPVDCIEIRPRSEAAPASPEPAARDNRRRYTAHGVRASTRAAQRAALLAERKRRAWTAAGADPAATETP
jgi:electron transport complex protein RnfB